MPRTATPRPERSTLSAERLHTRGVPTHETGRYLVPDGKILEAHERAIFDPARRVLRRLIDGIWNGERRAEELASLLREGLGYEGQRGIEVLLNTFPPNSARHSQLTSKAPHVPLLLTPRLTRVSASDDFLCQPRSDWSFRRGCIEG